jgi:hypothetical protein
MRECLRFATRFDAACQYVKLGYPVLPIKPGEKRPLTTHGLHDATTNEAVLREWRGRWPEANIAIRCDKLAVIDIDPGASWPPEDLRQEIKATKPALQRTPRGGWHIIFRLPEGKAWGPTTGKIAEHIDTRCGQGCYLMVAPSTTERGRYRWIRPLVPPDDLPLPPAGLIKALDEWERRPLRYESYEGDPAGGPIIEEGCRNAELTRLAGKLRRAGLSQTEIETTLFTANRLRCRPPLPDSEVARIAKSVARYPAGGQINGASVIGRAWAKAIQWRRRHARHN